MESPIHDVRECNRILVATNETQHFDGDLTFDSLRLLDRKGAVYGSTSSGNFALAKVGLLDSCRCTIHWESLSVFHALSPHLNITNNLCETDRNRGTSSDNTATLDMMLKFVEQELRS